MRILLVDDELMLVHLLETFLRQNGYDVDACTTAAAALDLFKAAPGRYDLVMADVTMPEMSGDELVRRIARVSESVRILLTSGLPFNVEQFPESVQSRTCFLQKPFLPRMVIQAITQLMQDGSRAQSATKSTG